MPLSDVVPLVEMPGGENQTDGVGREVFELAPEHRRHVQPQIRAIQRDGSGACRVVDYHIEAAREGEHDLLEGAIRVATARRAAGDVVDPVRTLDREWHMTLAFDERQV